MIKASRTDCEKAFKQVLSYPGITEGKHSSYLIQFYRVECGLKTLLYDMQRQPASTGGDPIGFKHNLSEIVRELKIPAQAIGKNVATFRLQRDAGSVPWPPHPIKEAHEVWRYGVAMHHQDEIELVQWLNRLVTYIENQL
jgi:hypothetical protein